MRFSLLFLLLVPAALRGQDFRSDLARTQRWLDQTTHFHIEGQVTLQLQGGSTLLDQDFLLLRSADRTYHRFDQTEFFYQPGRLLTIEKTI